MTRKRFAIWSADLYWDQEVTEFYEQDVHSLRGRRHLKRHDHLADVERQANAAPWGWVKLANWDHEKMDI